MKKLSKLKKLTAVFVIAASVVVINAIIIYSNTFRLFYQQNSVNQALQVISQLERTLLEFINTQISFQTYLVTNNQNYLSDYRVGVEQTNTSLKQLQTVIKASQISFVHTITTFSIATFGNVGLVVLFYLLLRSAKMHLQVTERKLASCNGKYHSNTPSFDEPCCQRTPGAMPQGGKLTLHLNGADTESNFVIITVTDTGIGIPASNLEHIFEPFFTTKQVGS